MKVRKYLVMVLAAAVLLAPGLLRARTLGQGARSARGQEARSLQGVAFQTREWDFGSLREEDGAVEHDFPFRNGTGRGLRIGTVSVSCSCLQARFPHEEIPAGGTGTITLRMSPAGAAGKTRRHADVYTADGTYLGRLNLVADVAPMDVALEERYRAVLAPRLRTIRTSVPFGYVRKDSCVRREILLANPSGESVRVSAQSTLFNVEGPADIPPGGEASWTVSCTPREAYGVLRDSIRFFTDGVPAGRAVAVSAICLGPESHARAVLRTTPSEGKLRRGKGRMELENGGEEELVILGVDAPEGVEVNLRPGMRLAAGKTREVKVSSQLQTFDINIFTNDPERPFKALRFSL